MSDYLDFCNTKFTTTDKYILRTLDNKFSIKIENVLKNSKLKYNLNSVWYIKNNDEIEYNLAAVLFHDHEIQEDIALINSDYSELYDFIMMLFDEDVDINYTTFLDSDDYEDILYNLTHINYEIVLDKETFLSRVLEF